MNYENMPTDIQYKNDLRKERIFYEELLEILENEEYDRLKKKLKTELERVEASLQD